MDVAAKFEKNRRALLRMVVCWLALASFARRARLLLPRWARFHLTFMVLKAEAATGCLVAVTTPSGDGLCQTASHCLDAARRHHMGLFATDKLDILDLETLIARLRALRALLRVITLCTTATIAQTAPRSSSPRRGEVARRAGEGAWHPFAPLSVPP